MQSEKAVEHLNSLLRGEISAVETYRQAIPAVTGPQPQSLGASSEKRDGGELIEAMPLLGRGESAVAPVRVARFQLRRHDQVIADRQKVEARPLGSLGDGHVGFARREDAPGQCAEPEFHALPPVPVPA